MNAMPLLLRLRLQETRKLGHEMNEASLRLGQSLGINTVWTKYV